MVKKVAQTFKSQYSRGLSLGPGTERQESYDKYAVAKRVLVHKRGLYKTL